MTDALVVLSTFPDANSAAAIAKILVADNLAACVNVVAGLRSIYRWQGDIQDDAEVLLIIKTTSDRYAKLQEYLANEHPYDCPEILALPVADGLPAYLSWLSAPASATAN